MQTYLMLILLPLLPLAGACASAPAGHTSLQGYSEAIFAAITRKDHDAVMKLMPPESVAIAACPDMKEEELIAKIKRSRAMLEAAYLECAEIDWTDAELVKVEGGEHERSPEQCTAATRVDAIKLTVALPSGEQEIEVSKSMLADRHYYLTWRLSCADRSVVRALFSLVAVVERLAEDVCACVDRDCVERETSTASFVFSELDLSVDQQERERIREATNRIRECVERFQPEE